MWLTYLDGNFDSHERQQLGRFDAAIWTSHCRIFSIANGSPGWRTNGFCVWRMKSGGRWRMRGEMAKFSNEDDTCSRAMAKFCSEKCEKMKKKNDNKKTQSMHQIFVKLGWESETVLQLILLTIESWYYSTWSLFSSYISINLVLTTLNLAVWLLIFFLLLLLHWVFGVFSHQH